MTAVRLPFSAYTRVTEVFAVQYDGRSMALESGRYMETVGKWPVRLIVKPKLIDVPIQAS